jgi:hypothetical protein
MWLTPAKDPMARSQRYSGYPRVDRRQPVSLIGVLEKDASGGARKGGSRRRSWRRSTVLGIEFDRVGTTTRLWLAGLADTSATAALAATPASAPTLQKAESLAGRHVFRFRVFPFCAFSHGSQRY